MLHLLHCFIALFTFVDLHANPIAIDAENRPTTMLAENVDVVVGVGKSEVNGVFRFQQQSPVEKNQHTHVRVFVPVLVPSKLWRDYLALFGAPKVEFAGRTYSLITWDDLTSPTLLSRFRSPAVGPTRSRDE